MASRRTGSGRLMLDTSEWEALKDEVVDEVRGEVRQEAAQAREPPEVPGARPGESGDFIRAIAGEVYAAKQQQCFTTGPVGQLTTELRLVKQEVNTVTSDVKGIQSELKTAREMKELQDRTFNRRLTLIVGGFTMLGVMGNLVNIIWTLVHRGH